MSDNRLEWSKTPEGKVRGTVRSDHTTDIGANLEDPASDIVTIATLAGLEVTVQARTATDTHAEAS